MGHSIDTGSYYESRAEVGKILTQQLLESDTVLDDPAVLAVSAGGAVIGIEFAKELHAILGLMLLKHIYLPGERKPLGVVNEQGELTYGLDISKAFIEEFQMEYHGLIDNDRREAVHEMHAIGKEGELSPHYFSEKTVIVVSDFAKTGTAFKAAVDFLKPVHTKKIILVTAIAQLPAIDIMHVLGDQIVIAHATDKELPPDHYFQNDDVTNSALVELLKKQFTLKL